MCRGTCPPAAIWPSPASQVTGRLKIRLLGAYLSRLHAAAVHDPHLATAFIRVAGLVAPPQSLLRPGIAFRVLRGALHRRPLSVYAAIDGDPTTQVPA